MATRRSVLTGLGVLGLSTALPAIEKNASAAIVTSPVLFLPAHQDDETLAMGVAIAEHVAAGQDVHVAWLTNGTASGARAVLNGTGVSSWWGVQHHPEEEGYSALSEAQFGAARSAEAVNAMMCLSSGLPGTLSLHFVGLTDGELTVASVKDAIVGLADEIAPGSPVRLKAHTWVAGLDTHPDHIAVGAAARSLKLTDSRFSDLRHYILPQHWNDTDLSGVTESWDYPTDSSIASRAINACRAYGAWNPVGGSYAIGYHSVPTYFASLTSAPKCMYHA